MSLFSECRLQRLSEGFDIDSFDCSDSDLSEFLKKDALPFMKELLGVTYVFTPNRRPKEIVSFFTVSNDLIRVDTLYGSARKRIHSFIPSSKRMRAYPGPSK